MAKEKPNPLTASFWLTDQEKRYILIICALFLLGLVARYLYLNNRVSQTYAIEGMEQVEPQHE